VGFLVVALLALGFQLWLPRVLPQAADDGAVAEVLARESQPGDVVLLHPWWTERARRFLPPGLPVVGYLDDQGDALLEHPRIWVLAQPSLPRTPDATFEAAFLPGRTRVGPTRRLGPYALSLYRNGRAQPVRFSAVEAMQRASAAVEAPGVAPTPCTGDGTGFRCPGGARVEAGWHEVLYQPVRCLLVVPPGGPGAVAVTFDAVPAAATLRFEAGIIWEHAWKHGSNITPVRATLTDVDTGASLASLVVPTGREGLVSAQVPGGAHRLRVRVQSDSAHEREVCLVLRALDPAEGSR
jgi:hypothetical protein